MKRSVIIILLLLWPFYLNDFYLIALQNSNLPLLWQLDLVFYFLIPTATLTVLFLTGRCSLRETGLKSPVTGLCVTGGMFWLAGSIIFFHWLLDPMLAGAIPGHLFGGYDFPADQPWRFIVIAYASLTGGVLEEVICRGIVTTELKRHIRSAPLVVVLSCALFAGIHWSEGPARLISTGLWAVIPTIWFLRSGSLWGQMIAHVGYLLVLYLKLV